MPNVRLVTKKMKNIYICATCLHYYTVIDVIIVDLINGASTI